jgi:hypothetical protein
MLAEVSKKKKQFITPYSFLKIATWHKDNTYLLYVDIQFSWHYLLKRLSHSHCVFLVPLPKTSGPYMHELFLFSLPYFYWGVCLLLCQNHTVLITTDLWYSLKSVNVMTTDSFIFCKTALAIWGLLWFFMNFRKSFFSSISVKMLLEF